MKQLLLITFLSLSVGVFAQQQEKTYKLLASCGTCNFGMASDTGCALAVQIAGKHYWVVGSALKDHGNEHDPQSGMCRNVKKAEAVGYIKEDQMIVSSFVLIEQKKKNK